MSQGRPFGPFRVVAEDIVGHCLHGVNGCSGQYVCVFEEGDGLAGVAQQPGDIVQRNLLSESKCRERVAQTMESHVSNPGPFTITPKTLRDGVRARGAAVGEDDDKPCIGPS
jgi:hypothetical protein